MNRWFSPAELDNIGHDLPAGEIFNILNFLNIKLRRHIMDSKKHLGDFIDPVYRQQINDLAFELNRERSSHPAERRLGEDEKTSLFYFLLSQNNLSAIDAIFNDFFRNDPEANSLELKRFIQLLEYFTLEEIEMITDLVLDNPK